MQSGEADTYFNTFKHLLEDMSSLVVYTWRPGSYVDGNVKNISFTFKGLTTDQTIMHSSSFKKFQHWREEIIPFVVENFSMVPNAMKKKKSATCTTFFVGCMSYITLVHMQRKSNWWVDSGKRLSRYKTTCMGRLQSCSKSSKVPDQLSLLLVLLNFED